MLSVQISMRLSVFTLTEFPDTNQMCTIHCNKHCSMYNLIQRICCFDLFNQTVTLGGILCLKEIDKAWKSFSKMCESPCDILKESSVRMIVM